MAVGPVEALARRWYGFPMARAAWWLLGGAALAGAGAAVVAWRNAQDEQDAEDVVTTQTDLAAFQGIPFRTRRWAQSIASAAVKTAPAGVDAREWGRVIAGVIDRESWGGDMLNPRDPSGVGDPAPRTLERIQRANPALVPLVRPVGTDAQGRTLVLPADLPGWGRGLMQADWMSEEFARTGNWRDPNENILTQSQALAKLVKSYAGSAVAAQLAPGNLGVYRLALAAYNAGAGNVHAALAKGLDPDAYTTGANYGQDVLRRAGLAAAPAVA